MGGGSASPSLNGTDSFFATRPQVLRSCRPCSEGGTLFRMMHPHGEPLATARYQFWPDGFTAGRDQSGRLMVRDAEGATIAIEGEAIRDGRRLPG
jgi:hypothetical protein